MSMKQYVSRYMIYIYRSIQYIYIYVYINLGVLDLISCHFLLFLLLRGLGLLKGPFEQAAARGCGDLPLGTNGGVEDHLFDGFSV